MTSLFQAGRPLLVGMVHLGPLLAAGRGASLAEVDERAARDTAALVRAGFDAVLVENFGDAPFYPDRVPRHTVAAMTRAALVVRHTADQIRPGVALGVNVLRNDAQSAIAVAAAVDAQFIRVNVHTGAMVTDQGVLEGRAHETCRYRDQLAPELAIWADLRVKHAAPLVARPLLEEAEELWSRGRADAIIVSGSQTGRPADHTQLAPLRESIPGVRLAVGSGVTPDQLPRLVGQADALIVGTWLKVGSETTAPVDQDRARAFVDRLRALLDDDAMTTLAEAT